MIKRPPFTRTHLDDSRDVVSVSLNEREREMLDAFAELCDIPSDSRAFKYALQIALNVIHGTLGSEQVRFLVKPERARRRGKRPKWAGSGENVVQEHEELQDNLTRGGV